MSVATYSFLPYLRQGLANSLKNTGGARAIYTVNLQVEGDGGAVSGTPAARDVELYGPGDIVGIDSRIVLKTDPLNWITNFEPNYLAYIDFYDEDFPWRYTPIPPEATHRLKPWIALVVLKESEFDEGKNVLNRPLPFFTLKGIAAADVFPKADQLWAWAHVHVNKDIVNATIENNPDGVLDKLQAELNAGPDIAYSRLVCPRKLEAETKYHAFLIPAFESGRLAGLGESPANISAAGAKVAWQDGTPADFPIYHRWEFSTGTVGDFEYLVRLLKPMPVDLRVGRRDMDMTRPGANLQWAEAPDLDLEGILRLGGALQVPRKTLPDDERNKLDTLDAWGSDRLPHPFQKQIAALLNLADEYSIKPADQANAEAEVNADLPIDPNDDADPLITPPIYGRWHAMVERVLEDRNGNAIHNNYNWINELNLDPRYRVPAHFGTRVVQENQEEYMNAAWEQIGDVLKANRQIRYAQFAQSAAMVWYQKCITPMAETNPEKFLMLAAPVQKRILTDGMTVYHSIRESILPTAVLSAPMRRIARPGSRLIKDLQLKNDGVTFRPEAIIGKLNSGEVSVSPPKALAPGMLSANEISELFTPTDIPKWILDAIRKFPWLPVALLLFMLLIVILLILFSAGIILSGIGIAFAMVLAYGYFRLARWNSMVRVGESIKPLNQTPEVVDRMARSADFELHSFRDPRPVRLGGGIDSESGTRFKAGLRDAFEVVKRTHELNPQPAPLKPINIKATAARIAEKINPEKTIPAWTWQNIRIPNRILGQLVKEFFTEAMAYPRFDYPMYKPLVNISADLFLPNIHLIEYNSITLLETNQEFIESYMVGLNHEFARELLWREYPTDQRGSYFRQFWDVSTLLISNDPDHAGKTQEQIREMYRDIPKLHYWSRNSKLGSHDHRQRPGEPEVEEVVLVIRGELLKKYPNAVVYAHKAVWAPKSESDPAFDKTKSRVFYQEGIDPDTDNVPFDVVRTPLYKAQVDPDITFFGFKLDVEEAKGDSDPDTPTLGNAGWFFVIKERPGEPRFGFDIPKEDVDAEKNLTWNDISWSEVLPGEGVVDVINTPAPIGLSATVPPGTEEAGLQEFQDQRDEDLQIRWNTNGHSVDAADLAYILYQVPVLVAVHASEMLPKTS